VEEFAIICDEIKTRLEASIDTTKMYESFAISSFCKKYENRGKNSLLSCLQFSII
jgi:hypothetical protein